VSAIVLIAVALGASLSARSHGIGQHQDRVIQAIWETGTESSSAEEYAHVLIDRIGSRLAGSPALEAAQQWLMGVYDSLGIQANKEQYGTWKGWKQGILHVDLVHPRIETLEAEMLAWSPGTVGSVEGEVVLPPLGLTERSLGDWLTGIRGKFILTTAPEPMCRAPQELEANGRPATVRRIDSLRTAIRREWSSRTRVFGGWQDRERTLDRAGAAGIISSRWSGGWGAHQTFETMIEKGVGFELSCEDYGLLVRLIEAGERPVLRVEATAEDLGELPQYNVIATLPGSELPEEYVLLGAHLDSWHSATGATDNGTGTITMLEAARILKEVYPDPRRTILVGHWGAEEFGLIGSGSFREDHPEVMDGLQAAFNQDNGTWRVEMLEGQGFQDAVNHIPRWLEKIPREMSEHIRTVLPGDQENASSDHGSFLCAGAPSFRLQSPYDEYRQYTWHTNRDTYDKIVFDDLRENAILTAMLAYLASEDPQRFRRERATLPDDRSTGDPQTWVECVKPQRSFSGGGPE
jgi:carboxypeptidase Q